MLYKILALQLQESLIKFITEETLILSMLFCCIKEKNLHLYFYNYQKNYNDKKYYFNYKILNELEFLILESEMCRAQLNKRHRNHELPYVN